jgi:hypothetical protein
MGVDWHANARRRAMEAAEIGMELCMVARGFWDRDSCA